MKVAGVDVERQSSLPPKEETRFPSERDTSDLRDVLDFRVKEEEEEESRGRGAGV